MPRKAGSIKATNPVPIGSTPLTVVTQQPMVVPTLPNIVLSAPTSSNAPITTDDPVLMAQPGPTILSPTAAAAKTAQLVTEFNSMSPIDIAGAAAFGGSDDPTGPNPPQQYINGLYAFAAANHLDTSKIDQGVAIYNQAIQGAEKPGENLPLLTTSKPPVTQSQVSVGAPVMQVQINHPNQGQDPNQTNLITAVSGTYTGLQSKDVADTADNLPLSGPPILQAVAGSNGMVVTSSTIPPATDNTALYFIIAVVVLLLVME